MLPRFSYRAVMGNGIVERELCPVYRVLGRGRRRRPTRTRSDDVRWMPWNEFAKGVLERMLEISPWCGEQVRQLVGLGADPLGWQVADSADLPPAAR